jgi:hypothetical protein
MFSKARLLLLALLIAFACAPASADIYWYVDDGYVVEGDHFRVWAYYRAWVIVWDECWYGSESNTTNQITAEIATNGPESWFDDEYGYGSTADINGDTDLSPGSYYRVFADAWFWFGECQWGVDWPTYGTWEWKFLDGTPGLYGADPGEGEPGQTGTMVVSGDLLGFTPVSVYVVSGEESCGISFGDASSLGRYALSAPYEIAMADNGSQCKLKVTNAYGNSLDYMMFTTHLYAPEISLSPSSAQRGTSGTLGITGEHLYPGLEVSTDCSGMSLGSINRQSNQSIYVPYTIAGGATPGTCTIQVGNGFAWTTATNNFTITQ